MMFNIELHLWMAVPLGTTIFFAWLLWTAVRDGAELGDVAGMLGCGWALSTVPALLAVWLK